MVEKTSAQRRLKPNSDPAFDAVVMVPGPINAAEITDQKSMFNILFFIQLHFSNEIFNGKENYY